MNLNEIICNKNSCTFKNEKKLYGLSNVKLIVLSIADCPYKNHVLIQSRLLRALRQNSMFFELCRKAPRRVIGAHYEMNILEN